MKDKRMTGLDYRKKLKELTTELNSLDVHITDRLCELVRIHPEAVIQKLYDGDVQAKCLTPRSWIETLDVKKRIEYIEKIEKWSSERQRIVQLEIET